MKAIIKKPFVTEFGLYSVGYRELRSLLCRELLWLDVYSRRITLEAV